MKHTAAHRAATVRERSCDCIVRRHDREKVLLPPSEAVQPPFAIGGNASDAPGFGMWIDVVRNRIMVVYQQPVHAIELERSDRRGAKSWRDLTPLGGRLATESRPPARGALELQSHPCLGLIGAAVDHYAVDTLLLAKIKLQPHARPEWLPAVPA